jgi:hypothetical protein
MSDVIRPKRAIETLTMNTFGRFFLAVVVSVILFSALLGNANADEPCVCGHTYFGSPKEGIAPFAWEMPESALKHLTEQADQRLLATKQYFWCPKTFSALTYSNGTGFRFLVCPYSWTGFRPVPMTLAELKKRVMNLDQIEALLDSPSVHMGVVEVRVTAMPNGGAMGGPAELLECAVERSQMTADNNRVHRRMRAERYGR